MKTIIVQTFANNEIRIRWQDLPPVRKQYGDRAADRHVELESLRVVEAAGAKQKELGIYTYHDKDGERYIGSRKQGFDTTRGHIRSNLDIISKFQQPDKRGAEIERIKRSTPSRTAFGRNARHIMLEAGAVTERWTSSPSKSAFVTLTLPGSTKDAYSAIAKWSGFICNRLTQWLRRKFPKCTWFYVWELQSRGALHLHLCISSLARNEAMVAGRCVAEQWYKVLEDVGRYEGTCLFTHSRGDRCTTKQYWQCTVERVRKSVAAYVSKYVSKTVTKEKKGFGERRVVHPYCPRRWWGMSSKLRRMIKDARSECRFEGCTEQNLVDALAVLHGCARRFDPVRSHGYTFQVSHGLGDRARVVGSGHCQIYYFMPDGFDSALFGLTSVLRYVRFVLMETSYGYKYGDPGERGFSSGLRTLSRLSRDRPKTKRRLSSRRVASFVMSRQQVHHAC